VSIKTKDKSKKTKINNLNSPLEWGKGDVPKKLNRTALFKNCNINDYID
jgi:hypothetical protein